jgi:hypothetical protein
MTQDHTLRDGMIHNAVEARRADDVKIMAKVNAVNREAFVQKFPGQLEHSQRLIVERLMHVLSKPPGVDLTDPATWLGSPGDIQNLCDALHCLEAVRQNWPIDHTR